MQTILCIRDKSHCASPSPQGLVNSAHNWIFCRHPPRNDARGVTGPLAPPWSSLTASRATVMTNDTGPVITARLHSPSAAALLRATKNTPSSVINRSVPPGEWLPGLPQPGLAQGTAWNVLQRRLHILHSTGRRPWGSRAPRRVGIPTGFRIKWH